MCEKCLPFSAIAVHEPADGYGRMGAGTAMEWFQQEVSATYQRMVDAMKASDVPIRAVVVTIRLVESTEDAKAIAFMEGAAEETRRELMHGLS